MNKRNKKSINKTLDVRQVPSGISNGAMRRLFNNKIAIAGFTVFFIICIACIMAPVLTKWNYYSISVENRMQAPSSTHIFGTDSLGRDTFTRLLYGGRITLAITFISTTLAMLIGGISGIAIGYFGGLVDFIISPILNIIASIPMFLLAIVFEAVFGFGRGYFMYAMLISAIPQFAWMVRASVVNIRKSLYIEAARALGVSHIMIIIKHVLHNIASQLIVSFTTGLADTLILCTIMGYLGVGIRPPTPEWGAIVSGSLTTLRTRPHVVIIPCAIITICIISLSFFCDGLRDAFDPIE